MGSFPDLVLTPIIRDIREQQEWAAPWGKPNWVLSVKQGGQQCPPQQGPNATMPKADEQSSFSCINWSEENLKAKLKWWRMAQVKLRSQVSQCGSGAVTRPSSVPLQWSQAGLEWDSRQVKVVKCKPGSQVSRSGSGSAGNISRHRQGSTVAQSAAKDKSLSSNFSAKEGGGTCFSQQCELRLCSCAIPAPQNRSNRQKCTLDLRKSDVIGSAFVVFCCFISELVVWKIDIDFI